MNQTQKNSRFSHSKKRIYLVSVTALLLLTGCNDLSIPFFHRTVPPEPCDPASSLYQGDNHYIDREMLDEEGQVDYRKLFQAVRPESSPCDPLHDRESQIRTGSGFGVSESLDKNP